MPSDRNGPRADVETVATCAATARWCHPPLELQKNWLGRVTEPAGAGLTAYEKRVRFIYRDRVDYRKAESLTGHNRLKRRWYAG